MKVLLMSLKTLLLHHKTCWSKIKISSLVKKSSTYTLVSMNRKTFLMVFLINNFNLYYQQYPTINSVIWNYQIIQLFEIILSQKKLNICVCLKEPITQLAQKFFIIVRKLFSKQKVSYTCSNNKSTSFQICFE